jgi:hypothetical protein
MTRDARASSNGDGRQQRVFLDKTVPGDFSSLRRRDVHGNIRATAAK